MNYDMMALSIIYVTGCFIYFITWVSAKTDDDIRLSLFWVWPVLFGKFVLECLTFIIWFLLKNFVKDFWDMFQPSEWFTSFRR
jgi:hypothetical protein